MPTAYFFASAFDGSGLETLFESVSRKTSLNEKMFVLHVFWVKNSEISRDLISRAGESWPEPEIAQMVPKMLAESPRNILSQGPTTAADLDNLWAIFFATGAPAPVEQIASVLHLREDGHGMEIVVGGAASWSLSSNVRNYSEVKGVVEGLIEVSDGTQQRLLREVLKDSKADGR